MRNKIKYILNEIKAYIKTEQKDMYSYEDMSVTDRIETEKIIKALTDEKIYQLIDKEKIIKSMKEHSLDIIICDIFENVLYRISREEYDFLFKA